MFKKITSRFIIIGLILSLLIGVTFMTGCEPGVYINVKEITYTVRNSQTGEDVTEGILLNAGFEYIMEVKIVFCMTGNNLGDAYVNGVLNLYNAENLSGEVAEANTANIQKLVFIDEEMDGQQCKQTKLSFSAPKVANTEKTMNIKIRLTPKFTGSSEEEKTYCQAQLLVESSDEKTYPLDTDGLKDGKTFTINVVRTQLASPSLVIDSNGSGLYWNHIEHAESYDIYIEGVKFTSISATGIEVGEKITFTKSELDTALSKAGKTSSDYTIKIKAINNNGNYKPSTSNEVTYTYVSW